MKNILVGVDFHEKTGMLIDKAMQLAHAFGSKIWLLHIAAPDPDFVGYEAGPQHIRDQRAKELKEERKLLTAYGKQFSEQQIEAEFLLVPGATIETILAKAKQLDIDLIIAGHHDRSFLYYAFFDSVSSKIIRKSDIPVLVVPFGE